MNCFRLIAAFVFVGFALAFAAASEVPAAVGYAARGVILYEGNGTLVLTTTPCAGDAYKQKVRFRQPYDKNPSGSISCGRQSFAQFIVRQR